MRHFLIKLSLLSLVLIALLQLPSMLLPKFWGNEILDTKFVFLEKSNQSYDTFFIGTSRVNNQINPKYFDKLSKNTKSFNLGCSGASGLEILMAGKEIIDNYDKEPKTIFIECPILGLPRGKNAEAVRGKYFYYYNNWYVSVKHDFARYPKTKRRIQIAMNSLHKLVANYLHLGLLNSEVQRLVKGHSKSRFKKVRSSTGFHPLITTTKNVKEQKRREVLLGDTTILSNRRIIANKILNSNGNKLRENEYLTEKLIEMIDYGSERGIDVIYVLFPKSPEVDYSVVYPTFLALPKKNRINLANPKEHSIFYDLKYSFDKAHLNKKGSNLLTSHLYRIFNEKQSQSTR